MAETTIQWTATIGRNGIVHPGFTMNPWIGCEEVSPECDNCYARRGSARLGAQHGLKLWDGDRYFTKEGYWKQPLAWNREAERLGLRLKVFCASYSDVFEDRPDFVDRRARLLRLILETPHLDWLLLTKRPENMVRLAEPVFGTSDWPRNAWGGTTVGLQSSVHRAVKLVREVPASVLFLSCEPLLGDLNLDPPVCPHCWGLEYVDGDDGATPFCTECEAEMGFNAILDPLNGGVSWVIVGGESGPNARPFHLAWEESIRKQCKEAGVAYFLKQLGRHPIALDGTELALKDSHGGDETEWPEHLRGLRAFPNLEVAS